VKREAREEKGIKGEEGGKKEAVRGQKMHAATGALISV